MVKDERIQIGFRLVEKFKLDTIYSIDSNSVADYLAMCKDSTIIKPYFDSIFKDYTFKTNENYKKYDEYQTKLSLKLPLLDYFKIQNPNIPNRYLSLLKSL